MAIKPLPRNTSYTERDGKTKTRGKVVKEVWITDHHKFGTFRKVLQEIQHENRKKTRIRLGYYVKDRRASDKKYKWGSQTTFIMSKPRFRKLLRKAQREGIL